MVVAALKDKTAAGDRVYSRDWATSPDCILRCLFRRHLITKGAGAKYPAFTSDHRSHYWPGSGV
jgi:hypothetical protein